MIRETLANASCSYSDNYLIDTDHGVIVDLEATRSIRQAEVGSTKTMLKRVKEKLDLHPERLIADTAYGTGPILGWPACRKIAPHIPVFDKSGRSDGTWTRADFEWDADNDQYICPEGHALKQFRRNYSDPNRGRPARARRIPRLEAHLPGLPLETALLPQHGVPVHPPRGTRGRPPGRPGCREDQTIRDLDEAAEEGRDALRAPQAHPRPRKAPTTRPMGRERRIPARRHRPEPQETGKAPPRTAANAKSLRGKARAYLSSARVLRSRTGVFPQNLTYRPFAAAARWRRPRTHVIRGQSGS